VAFYREEDIGEARNRFLTIPVALQFADESNRGSSCGFSIRASATILATRSRLGLDAMEDT
jgi:hypothetical protein